MKSKFASLFFVLFGALQCAAQVTYTLPQLLDSALNHNIAVTGGQRRVDAAAEQRREAFTKYFPNVSATGAWFNANDPLINLDLTPLGQEAELGLIKNGTVAGVTAVQPVFAGGQIVNGNRLARVGEDAARLQLRLAEQEVEKQTEQYYWQLVSLTEKLKTIDAVDTLLADIAKDVSVAVEAGVALRNDLLQVQLRQNDLASQRLRLNNGIGIVRLLLTQYAGLSGNEEWKVTSEEFPFDVPSADSPSSIKAASDSSLLSLHSSLEGLPEYQLLEKQVEAAILQRKMETGKNLPTVAVGAAYSYNDLMDKSQNRGILFATVSVPLSDWWGGSHAIRRRKIEERQAVDELNDKSQLLAIRMQNAWNSVVEAQSQLSLAQRGIEQAEENLRLHSDFYRAGTCTMSDLLEAQLLYQQTLDRRVDAYAAFRLKLLEYQQAAGL